MTGKIVGEGKSTRYFVDGVQVSKRKFEKAFPPKPVSASRAHRYGQWPMKSDAMAVRPKQLELAKKLDRERGAPPTEYVQSGDGYTAHPVFTSESHKRKFIRAHKMHDNNSFYG